MGIRWSDWKRYLLPEEEQRDPALREELTRVAVVGLRAIVFITVVGVGFMLTVTTILSKLGYLSHIWVWPDLALMGTGLVGVPFWVLPRLRKHARLAGCVIGYGVALIFIVTAVTASYPGVEHAVPPNINLVMLVSIGAMPLRPLHTLALGSSMFVTYVGAMAIYPEKLFVPDVSPLNLASLVVVTLIFVGLTAVVYHQRASAFQARQQVLRAQAQVTLAKSAAAQGRLAAALSHELNSPIGVIKSNLSTLAVALEKSQAGEQPSDRLMKVLGDIETTARRSCERLSEVVGRMQRFTHLDRAEEAAVDVRVLLEDTVETLRAELEKTADITLELEPLPTFRCRPQQLSAVFTNLLLNARHAIGDNGTIHVRSCANKNGVVVEVEDDGHGIPAERLDQIFEPSFTVAEGRVSTGNWGLFNCRSIIHSLGGEIQLESVEGAGTTVKIILPRRP